MKILRIFLAIAMAGYMTTAGPWAVAQDANNSPFSITLAPVQYAHVEGNIGKFEALNWMSNGETAGVSDISFIKDINKDISVQGDGFVYPGVDTGKAELILKDGDMAFLRINYNAFRKYYDNTGGVDRGQLGFYNGHSATSATSGTIPNSDQGAQGHSPDLQMDISYFKLEAGLGPITDPFLDITYEHNSKNGDKSLLQWSPVYFGINNTSAYVGLGSTWEQINSTTDSLKVSEKKEFAGITLKGNQQLEVDYNNNITYMQSVNGSSLTVPNPAWTNNDSPDAKLFGSGVRAEKWMFNDNTYVSLGYHYNHTRASDLMEQQETTTTNAGVVSVTGNSSAFTFATSLWNSARSAEDDHVLVGNLNTNLTPNLVFITDVKYEHQGSEGKSTYYTTANGNTASAIADEGTADTQDNAAEHVSLRYSGIPHTSLYTEADMEQDRDLMKDDIFYTLGSNSSESTFSLSRLDRTEVKSWTVGGRVVPNRYFTLTNQVKYKDRMDNYDTISLYGSNSNIYLMDSIRVRDIEDDSTLTWRPFHWLQNSLKYNFYNTEYNPQLAALDNSGTAPVSVNRMLRSEFTYDITVQPIDPLLLMFTYSHVEDYVKTLADLRNTQNSSTTVANNDGIPTFNSGDNSFLLSVSYSPTEALVWTSTACYTRSNNYVNFSTGVPYGSDFKMLNFTSGLQWTYHRWLKVGPAYEYATYQDDPLSGVGNYSANIFELKLGFNW